MGFVALRGVLLSSKVAFADISIHRVCLLV